MDAEIDNSDEDEDIQKLKEQAQAKSGTSAGKKYQQDQPSSFNSTLIHLPKRPPVTLEFRGLSYKISTNHFWQRKVYKTIIKDVNGKLMPGTLNAIMGPSGAGKSTLMNILAGYKKTNVTGQVLINGQERNLESFKRISCYIMQDVKLIPYLTVHEAMMVAANLKLAHNISKEEKLAIVEDIIETLGISQALNTRSGKLSGGQGKRLSVALELLSNPPLMFLDEPTSGLDSSTCSQLCLLLQNLARGGRTIVCTIHQPSARIFELFDTVYLIAEGYCIYTGSVRGIVPYFAYLGYKCPAYHNPADFMMEVANGEFGYAVARLSRAVKANVYTKFFFDKEKKISFDSQVSLLPLTDVQSEVKKSTQALSDGHPKTFAVNYFWQFRILMQRNFTTLLRNPALTQTQLGAHFFIGLLVGALFYNIGNDAAKVRTNTGLLFIANLFLMFSSMMRTILTFPLELDVFAREILNSWYSLISLYLAKTIVEIPFTILFISIYVCIVYYLTNQPRDSDRVVMFLLGCILIATVAKALGLLIGTAFGIQVGVLLGPILAVPMTLFCGFLISFDDIPDYLKFMSYISYVRYGFEGSVLTVYGFNRSRLECSIQHCLTTDPKFFLNKLGMEDDWHYSRDMYILALIAVSLTIVTYFILRVQLSAK